MLRLRVKEILKEKGFTMYWLSKQTGISPNNVSRLCSGEITSIRFSTLEALCKVLNCTIGDLFSYKAEE